MNTPSRTEWGGRYRALVIDDRDPLFKMRVKVRIPDLMIADEKHVGKWDTNGLWASPSNNYLGGRTIQDTKMRHKGPDAYYQGSCLIPPKGSHVWVWFEKNDISHPFYDGAAEYGDVQALPENQLGNQYQKKWTLFKSCQGRCLVVSDDDDDARFEITGKKREIKDPPFGDIDSVYKIDDNQSVFLIDERPQHEKILLKDYRGNFMKLIQDENGMNDQLHVKIQNDVHMEFQKDFYLTVFGNMHIKVLGDIYVTSLKDIFVNATLKLQETALSIDRFATTYDNTFANLINNVSTTNINSYAVMKIFEQSLQNVRNSMVTSDVSVGLTTIEAGAAIGITAGGAVSIYGGGGTAIQSTPVSNPLSGNSDMAEIAPTATESKPDPERYEKIILPPGGPILTTPTSKDSLKGDKVCHDPVKTSQCASSKVGSAGGSSAVANAAAPGCCGGGSDGQGETQKSSCGGGSKGSSSGSGATQGQSGLNPGTISRSPVSNPDSDLPNYDFSSTTTPTSGAMVTSDGNIVYPDGQVSRVSPIQSINDCCSNAFNGAVSDIASADSAVTSVLGVVEDVISAVSDSVFSVISGLPFTPYSYTPNIINQVVEQAGLGYNPYYTESIGSMSNDLMNTIVNGISVHVPDFSGIAAPIYDTFTPQYSYLSGEFEDYANNFIVNAMFGNYSAISPDLGYYSTQMLDSVLSVVTNGISDTSPVSIFKNSLISAIYNTIDAFSFDFAEGFVNTQYAPISDIFMTNISQVGSSATTYIDSTIRTAYMDIVSQISSNVLTANEQMFGDIRRIANHISPIGSDSFLPLNYLQDGVVAVSDKLMSFANIAQSDAEIAKFKEDPDRFEVMKQQLISDCKDCVTQNPIPVKDVNTKFAIAGDTISNEVQKALQPLNQPIDTKSLTEKISGVNQIISEDLEKDSYTLTNDFEQFKENSKSVYAEKISEKIKNDYKDRINAIVDEIPTDENKDTVMMSKVRTEIENLSRDMINDLKQDGIFSQVVTRDDVKVLVGELENNIKQHFPTRENNTSKQAISDFKDNLENEINISRQETLSTIFDLDTNIDNQFNKYSTKTYSVPAQAGCGLVTTLYLKDKYRKTILPLISNSGGNTCTFDIIYDTDKFEYTINKVWSQEDKQFYDERVYHPFFDKDAIESYENIWIQLENKEDIDTTTKWWTNLKEFLTECSIYDIVAVITIQDFRSLKNPFLKNIASNKVYTDAMWRDDVEGKFLSTLFEFIRTTEAKVLYNFGYGSFTNSFDINHEKYKMYPNCGYLRKMIMWCVYKCHLTSNLLGLTANEDNNLYYYNPYCEWRVYDDNKDYDIDGNQIFIRFSVDGKRNDEADIVTYTKGKITGGYAKYLCDCGKHTIVIFNTDDILCNIPSGADINDPNIMAMIFCKNSRTALRYFKGNNYFDFKELEFDKNGDVI